MWMLADKPAEVVLEEEEEEEEPSEKLAVELKHFVK